METSEEQTLGRWQKVRKIVKTKRYVVGIQRASRA